MSLRRTFASCSLAWLSAAAPSWAQDCVKHVPAMNHYDFQMLARQSVLQPLAQQARNGQILDQTFYEYHFHQVQGADGKSHLMLHPLGQALAQRLVRRHEGHGFVEFFLQKADIVYNVKTREQFAEFVASANAGYLKAVVEYVQAAHPSVAFTVRVIDAPPIGMAGVEAGKAYAEVMATPRGIIPLELRQGLGNFINAAGGGQPSVGGASLGGPLPPDPAAGGGAGLGVAAAAGAGGP